MKVNEALNIIIVEDSPDDAVLLADALSSAGFAPQWKRVETKADFSACLNPDVDLIFSDFSLPQFSLSRALALLNESKLEIPFIIVSGTIGEVRAVEALKAGATDYVSKDQIDRIGLVTRRALREAKEIRVRKALEQELVQREQRLRQLAENINEVFWMADLDTGKMLYVNPAYERIWGRSIAKLYESPRDWIEAVHPDDWPRVSEALAIKQKTGDYNEIYRIQRSDGSIRWIHDRAVPIRDESGRIYRIVGTAEDITEQQQLEAQLRQAQKMEAIGTLAGGIAHDFNNILSAIMGYTDLATNAVKEDMPHVEEYLKEVCRAASRARDLIKQILAFSRQQEHKLQPIQPRHVVAEALKLLRVGTPSTIEFDTNLKRDTPMISADATQIHQIVINLGTNASHAIGDKPGIISTTTERFVIDANSSKANPRLKPGVYARLSIRDTGHGMTHNVQVRIFEPFFTTKPAGEGTGLGLSVVHGILQAHGGVIEVSSETGKGTLFQLYFPALPEAQINCSPSPENSPRGRGERIMIVDDEAALLAVTQKVLEKSGYAVTAVSNSEAAIEIISSRPNDFALVLTDLTMPGMTGLELARKIWEIRPKIPIMLMTGYSGSISLEAAREMGFCDLLFKPLTYAAITAAIYQALQRNICAVND